MKEKISGIIAKVWEGNNFSKIAVVAIAVWLVYKFPILVLPVWVLGILAMWSACNVKGKLYLGLASFYLTKHLLFGVSSSAVIIGGVLVYGIVFVIMRDILMN